MCVRVEPLCSRAIASSGVPHEDAASTVMLAEQLRGEDAAKAARIYFALIGERMLPDWVGRKDPRPTSPARDFLNRQAAARREVEVRRDSA